MSFSSFLDAAEFLFVFVFLFLFLFPFFFFGEIGTTYGLPLSLFRRVSKNWPKYSNIIG